ncbi:MAG TPA: site-2 protease family protein [Solirubrobacteraceae bacterium]|jgi:regulator of sigma E protease|nr:site-2 protease family protein [Solirubrobacteraceae bacterium]
MSWLLAILGIVALIVLHELGHFAVAKAVGMRVERFSLFFPPTVFRVKRGETEYAIGALPAGGYVKITGMNPEELEGLEPEVRRRAYYSQPPWKRIAVILAGPGVNVVIAFVLFWAVLYAGSLEGSIALGNLDPKLATISPSTSVLAIDRGAPAYGYLRPGDRIVSVDGVKATVQSVRNQVNAHRCAGTPKKGCRAATPVSVTVARGGHDVALALYPRLTAAQEANGRVVERMLLGFEFGSPKAYGVFGAAGASLSVMWHTTTSTLTNFAKALTSSKTRHELHSIVGISQVGQETVAAGAGYALVFLGFLSLVLAVINLFPFLPLDGGHVLWSLAEKVRGRRVSLMAMYRFSSVGIVLLFFLVINGVSNDISRLTG